MRRQSEAVWKGGEWALSIPEIVNVSVNTPYPQTETFVTESRRLNTRDYRLFDIQHAVMPTKLPLERFYEELVKTQQVINLKHMGFAALRSTAALAACLLVKGQTNFVRMLWKFNSVYDPKLQLANHHRPVKYEMRLPATAPEGKVAQRDLYVLLPEQGKQVRVSAPSRHKSPLLRRPPLSSAPSCEPDRINIHPQIFVGHEAEHGTIVVHQDDATCSRPGQRRRRGKMLIELCPLPEHPIVGW